ncbi:LysR substrate-binding domain-containing protein [Pseudomonas sp. 20S_6.2_Bac1]|nr:LysR substrate-binding domain-containing protein [Pseudomonas sp. 20S_6.2_Bac1]
MAYRPAEGHDLWFEPLYNEEMVLVVANYHPLAKRRKVRMIELHNLRMTLLRATFSTRQSLMNASGQLAPNLWWLPK